MPSYVLILLGVVFTTLVCARTPCNSCACWPTPNFNAETATIDSIWDQFFSKSLSSKDLVCAYLKRIALYDGPSTYMKLRSILEVSPETFQLAKKADKERADKCPNRTQCTLNKLHGIPIVLKDNIDTFDQLNTTSGSYILLQPKPAADATIARLLRNAGAIILGKAQLSQWSNFRSSKAPSGWSSRGGQCLNPYNASFDVFGSSSGSAVSVAASLITASIGTETSGSLIAPARVNGVFAIKPTTGLTSRVGVVPISIESDTVGPVCRTPRDCAYLLDVIAQPDPADPFADRIPASAYHSDNYYSSQTSNLTGFKIGYIHGTNLYPAENGTEIRRLLNKLTASGAKVTTLPLDPTFFAELRPFISTTYLNCRFPTDIENYLKFRKSPITTLETLITVTENIPEERVTDYPLDLWVNSLRNNGVNESVCALVYEGTRATVFDHPKFGLRTLFSENNFDAMFTTNFESDIFTLALNNWPTMNIPFTSGPFGRPAGLTAVAREFQEFKLVKLALFMQENGLIGRVPPVLSTGKKNTKYQDDDDYF